MKNVKTAPKTNASKESEFGRLTNLVKMLRDSEHAKSSMCKAAIGACLLHGVKLIRGNTSDERTARKTFRLWVRGVLPGWSMSKVQRAGEAAVRDNMMLENTVTA